MDDDERGRVHIEHTRRHFLKTVLFGTATAGMAACRRPGPSALAAPADAHAAAAAAPAHPHAARHLAGETFEVCHSIRDQNTFPRVAVTSEHDVVIVGGGPSGLTTALRLRDRDLLLLEKETVLGGNCTIDEWQGVRLSTGGAFYTKSEKKLVAFFDEIGAHGLPVVGPDALVIDREPVLDFFRDGARRLPFPEHVRDDFRRSRDELLQRYRSRTGDQELDRVPFAKLLAPYAPEVKRFWDRFGRSNWGGETEHTSGLIGCEAYTWAGGADDPRWTFPGGLAAAAHTLAERVKPALGDRLVTGASVYRVEREGTGARERVVIHYLKGDEPRAVRAKVAILAVPKYFAKHILVGLPEARANEMTATRYEPFLVINLCLERPGPEPAYDNWFYDTPFTDFIPADWVLYAGKGSRERRTALTVYHPLAEADRAKLLFDEQALAMVDGTVDGIERHFPGTRDKIVEARLFRRGHAIFLSSPGRLSTCVRTARPLGSVVFAHTDSSSFASFDGALESAENAVVKARALLRG